MVYHPTARVLSVLELLQTHGQMTGAALAQRLEVDVRTIRRYVTTLQDLGIPIDAEIGRYGGYSLRPGFKLPPLMFTNEEVLVLTLGLLMARHSGVIGASATVESALAKIERVLPFALRDQLRAFTSAMQLEDLTSTQNHPVDQDVIAVLSLAKQQQRQVTMCYISGSHNPDHGVGNERLFDPYAVINHQGRWYTVGYCHLRHACRVFRLDRIRKISLLDTVFPTPPTFDALDYLLSSFESIPDQWDIDVILETTLETARQRIPRSLATLVEMENGVRMRASLAELGDVARLLISIGCPLKVIQPPELRAEMLTIAARIAEYAQR